MPHAYAKEELEERYKKLPAALKDAMFSPEVAEKMFEIGKKNGLTIEKTGFMAEETGFIILGLTQPREFVKILSDRLETDRDAAGKIASDINHAILFPLREALKNTHEIDIGEASLQTKELPTRKPPAEAPASAPAPLTPPIPQPPSAPAPTKEETRVPAQARQPQRQLRQGTPASAPLPEKKLDASAAPAIPGFISRGETEKIVAAEKEKREEQAAPAPHTKSASLPKTPSLIDLRPSPQQIPSKSPPILPQPAPGKPMIAPPPIVIPPNPLTPPEPLKDIPQNPKIPPIDLRNAAKPAPAPPPPKTYEGYDPYREAVE
ncbi:MAG: hypothetical protein AAB915_02205 [Patescibacteria group bacterium]